MHSLVLLIRLSLNPLILKAISHSLLFDSIFANCLCNILIIILYYKDSSAKFMGHFTVFKSNILLCFWLKRVN